MKSIKSFSILIILTCFSVSYLFGQTTYEYLETTDSIKIAYTDEGEGNPIILIHGFINDGTSWSKTSLKTQLLEKGYRIIIPDLRGNGKSDKPQASEYYQNDVEIQDIIELMDHLQIKNYNAIGYSRGSIVLSKLLTKDNRIQKAVIGGMGSDFTNAQWPRRLMFADAFNGVEILPETTGAINYAKSIRADLVALGHMQSFQPVTSPLELSQINIPILVIVGDEDLDNGDPRVLTTLFSAGQFLEVKGDHNNAYKTLDFALAIINFLND